MILFIITVFIKLDNIALYLVFRLVLLIILLAGIVEKLIVTQIFSVVLRL